MARNNVVSAILSSTKGALFLCLLDVLFFFCVILFIEVAWLSKGVIVGAKFASIATLVRIAYFQVPVEFIAVLVCLYFTKRLSALFGVMAATFYFYFSLLRGEMIPVEILFSFGWFGETTPSFLAYTISSFLALMVFRKLNFGRK
ncbi:hypothetical protein [Woeseia oceani]|uniref:Uncharacterized protein n=1 Tax=Woeseia oceani TaxID=1548547 RepID=A0A193LJD4_9GAMM|nr:hypothetical protein [Woeseia oceani]ANO52509.1 hypothetical protein BA177_16135 [Woeseia oceani]